MRCSHLPLLLTCALSACAAVPPDYGATHFDDSAQDAFWEELQALCGQAFAGRVVRDTPQDPDAPVDPDASDWSEERLVMHVRSCSPGEIRIPFFVGDDRSRTWVFTRAAGGLRLKHDHRHPDGSEEELTQYGGDTADAGTSTAQDFHADAHTAAMLPPAAINVWTVEVEVGRRFAYTLRRTGTPREFRAEFDLRLPVPAPPPPWGTEPGE